MLTPEYNEFTSDSLKDDSIRKIETFKEELKLKKIKIFSKSGEIIYSSDPKDVGMINQKDYFRKIVAKVKITPIWCHGMPKPWKIK
jgi:two-component system cell cycle sensor histidine kinase/response regulator CckA